MTKEEAIKELRESHDMMRSYNIDENESRLMTALNMAIKALSQEPTKRDLEREYLFQSLCEDFKKLQAENDDLRKRLEQEPCDDVVSRDAVYSILKEYHIDEEEIESAMDDCQNLTVNGIASDVSLLPSVTQKSGKWVVDSSHYICSECNFVHHLHRFDVMSGCKLGNFCPNCGAKMESEE